MVYEKIFEKMSVQEINNVMQVLTVNRDLLWQDVKEVIPERYSRIFKWYSKEEQEKDFHPDQEHSYHNFLSLTRTLSPQSATMQDYPWVSYWFKDPAFTPNMGFRYFEEQFLPEQIRWLPFEQYLIDNDQYDVMLKYALSFGKKRILNIESALEKSPEHFDKYMNEMSKRFGVEQQKFDLQEASIHINLAEYGQFKTGSPVTFPYLRTNEKAGDFGEQFGQHLEPAGRYVIAIDRLEDGQQLAELDPNYEVGEMSFKNPLVIPWGGDYRDESNWKSVLAKTYGATGKRLSQKLAREGYDGIVTITNAHGANSTSEIVDISMFSPSIVEKKLQELKADIDLNDFQLHINKKLHPKIWNDKKLKPVVKDALMKIAEAFVQYLDIKELVVKDIQFTGSMANYNYTDYSDIDLHILIQYPEECESMKELAQARKIIWNSSHDIQIYDHDVELYPQDFNEPHISSGVYSVLKDEWVNEPTFEDFSVDFDQVINKAEHWMDQIDQAKELDTVNEIRDQVKKMRQSGLSTGGEYSIENLAFKILRNTGYLEILSKMKNSELDRALSVLERKLRELATPNSMEDIEKDSIQHTGEELEGVNDDPSRTYQPHILSAQEKARQAQQQQTQQEPQTQQTQQQQAQPQTQQQPTDETRKGSINSINSDIDNLVKIMLLGSQDSSKVAERLKKSVEWAASKFDNATKRQNEAFEIPFIGDNSLIRGISQIIGASIRPIGNVINDLIDTSVFVATKALGNKFTNNELKKLIGNLRDAQTKVKNLMPSLEQKISVLFGKNADPILKEIRDLVRIWNESINKEIQNLERKESPTAGLKGQGIKAEFEFPEEGGHPLKTKWKALRSAFSQLKETGLVKRGHYANEYKDLNKRSWTAKERAKNLGVDIEDESTFKGHEEGIQEIDRELEEIKKGLDRLRNKALERNK
jgi:hypothetical protein